MDQMKLKGQPGSTGFSFRGNWYKAINDVITVPLDAFETALAHGWQSCVDDVKQALDKAEIDK